MEDGHHKLFQRSKKITPGGVHSPVRSFKNLETSPLFFESAKGAYLNTIDGKKYIDYCQSFGPLILGHRDCEVQEKIHEVLNKAWSFGACSPYSLQLGEWMVAEIPWLESLRFVNSGTEAVMSALRLARAYTKRNKILKFVGCYHGHVDSMLVDPKEGASGLSSSSSEGISENITSETLVSPLDDEESVNKIFRKFAGDIAAIIIEPLPANYGLLPQRKEFLKFLKKKAVENKTLLIFDEVISGFRVSLGGMAQILDIKPDLVTYGKIIGGGFPVGCFAGKKNIMDHIAPNGGVYQAGTLSGNPVCMVAGLATLHKIKRENIIHQCNKKARQLSDEINYHIKKKGFNWQCVQSHSLFWMANQANKKMANIEQIPVHHKEGFNTLFHKLLSKGIYIAPAAFEVGFISHAHDDEILSLTIDAIINSLEEMY